MTDELAAHLMRVVVAHVLHQAGFERTLDSAHFVLADVMARYVDLVVQRAKNLAETQGRTEVNFDDVASALALLNVNVDDLIEFCASSLQIGADYSLM